MKTIIVSYESEVLGKGTFWRGDAARIEDINNIPAKRLAKEVALDGKMRKLGMWIVELEVS